MRSIGIHTYLGGMQLGVARVFNDLGSAESWKPGINARKRVGMSHRDISDAVTADVVYANPPCTRFSTSSTDMFGQSDRTSLSRFECLEECLDFALRCKADVFWWETGPLAFTQGAQLSREVADRFNAATQWTLRLNANDFGVPQMRTRTHFVYFKSEVGAPRFVAQPKIASLNPNRYLRDWLAQTVGDDRSRPAGPDYEYMRVNFGTHNIVDFVTVESTLKGRKAWATKLVQDDAETSPAILGRAMGFKERWLTLHESAALMGLPFWDVHDRWHPALSLMSKGVCTNVAEGVARQIRIALDQPRVQPPLNRSIYTLGRVGGSIEHGTY
jgi:site-specific DNA-cytosine methylase